MANLLNFVNPKLRSGEAVTFYFDASHLKSSGTAQTVEALKLQIHGNIDSVVYKGDFDVEITMPDEASSGTCSISFNGNARETAYHVDNSKLVIPNVDGNNHQMTMYNGGTKTRVTYSKIPGSIGIKAL